MTVRLVLNMPFYWVTCYLFIFLCAYVSFHQALLVNVTKAVGACATDTYNMA